MRVLVISYFSYLLPLHLLNVIEFTICNGFIFKVLLICLFADIPEPRYYDEEYMGQVLSLR